MNATHAENQRRKREERLERNKNRIKIIDDPTHGISERAWDYIVGIQDMLKREGTK